MSRRGGRDLGISLDSLLDAMFNVVGILVLVLILAQLSVSGAVDRLQAQVEDLPDIDPEAIELAEQRAEELRELIAKLSDEAEVATDQMEQDRITLTRLEAQIDRLEEMVAIDPELTAERERVEELLEELREQREQVNSQVADASDELQRLRAQLADLPEREEPAPEVVTLPNPREAPEGWEPEYVLVTDNRVYVYHMETMRERMRRALQSVREVPETDEYTGGRHREAFERRMELRPIEYGDFTTEYSIVGRYDNIVRFHFDPDEEAGTDIDDLADPGSNFFRAVRAAYNQRNYLVFRVTPDSFEAYLRAREVVDQQGVPAGWEIVSPNYRARYTLSGSDYRLNQLKSYVEEVDEERERRRAEREAAREDEPEPEPDPGPTIPPPAVERDVSGDID